MFLRQITFNTRFAKSAPQCKHYKKKTCSISGPVKWLNYNELQENPQTAIIIASEVLDAFAVHKVQFSKGKL
ncbi:MAG: SAM-dependent methyltransferase [Blastocatellia bacterium]|nr:SAM-dependent methyltransferase [Blastocatellia bacterium]